MSTKKKTVKKIPIRNKVVKAKSVRKIVTKKEPKPSTPKQKKVSKYLRVRTAEGWKRTMACQREEAKKKKGKGKKAPSSV